MESNEPSIDSGSAIQKFYSGKSIFITGGLGFLGKVLIEKLLRSCSEISTIYLLVRSKKGKSLENRLNEVFEASLYDRVRDKMPNFQEKIIPIMGDLNVEDLGMSDNDKNLLINNVSIIFHVAATVRFNETLKNAAMININGTKCILNLAKHIKNLQAFIHVSTLYAHCYEDTIEECYYTLPIDYKCLVKPSEDTVKEAIQISSQWPNTYTFTKAVAETLIKNEGIGLPIGIFRPSIVMPCANEPFTGWIDDYTGPMKLTMGFLSGVLKFLPCSGNKKIDFVPVDFTINALITSAWDVFNHPYRRDNNILIYNFASSSDAPTLRGYIDQLKCHYEETPINNIVWRPSLFFISHMTLYKICMCMTYYPIAIFLDIVRICVGQRPRMWNLCEKICELVDVLTLFMNNEWNITNKNVQRMWNCLNKTDQQMFTFNMKKFDWIRYFNVVYKGIRSNLFKEDDSFLKSAHIKKRRYHWIQMTLLIGFFLIISFITFSII